MLNKYAIFISDAVYATYMCTDTLYVKQIPHFHMLHINALLFNMNNFSLIDKLEAPTAEVW